MRGVCFWLMMMSAIRGRNVTQPSFTRCPIEVKARVRHLFATGALAKLASASCLPVKCCE